MLNSLESIHSKTRRAYNLAAQKYHDLFRNEMETKEYDRRLLDSFAQRFNQNSLLCDAGCGPSAHIGRYLFEKGIPVVGFDISDRCVELAQCYNPGMRFVQGDLSSTAFKDCTFDGILSYYSIIDTPKEYVGGIFREFHRILKPNGYLLLAVKAGTTEGYLNNLLGIETEIYFTLFTEEEITQYFTEAGFLVEFMEKRNPYDFEISNERIFAVGKRLKTITQVMEL